jgi:protein ATS1
MPLRLLSTGSNGSNQLGHSEREDTALFQPSQTPPGLTAVGKLAFGANHTVGLFRTADDANRWQVWGCGDGQHGQLGEAWTQTDVGFRSLKLPSPPVAGDWVPTHVACSWTTSFVAFALAPSTTSTPSSTSTSLVLALGSNDFSELGSGVRGSATPARQHWHVFDAETVSDLQAGPRHAMLVLQGESEASWRILGWGAARHGQLSMRSQSSAAETDQQRLKPKQTVTLDMPSLVLSAVDTLVEDRQAPIVALGFAHSVFFFQSSGKPIRLGGALSNEGLFLAPPGPLVTAARSSWHHLVYLLSDTRIAIHGRPSPLTAGHSTRVCTLGTAEAAVNTHMLAAGSEHVVALTQDGSVWAWGWNEHGNLGDGTTNDGLEPKAVWPPAIDANRGDRALAIWAGCGTSWILVEHGD